MERLYLWDEKTKYTEGLNEYGIAIVSAKCKVSRDSEEGFFATQYDAEIDKKPRVYYSPEGFRIRKALFEKDINEVVNKLIEYEVTGNTIIANKERCFILEAAFIDSEIAGEQNYVHKVKELRQSDTVVRTNHGVLLDWVGPSQDNYDEYEQYLSSVSRYSKVSDNLWAVKSASELLDCLSIRDDENNPQLNPLITDKRKSAMRTTGQIILIPSERLLQYRNIWGTTLFDMEIINREDEKTFFEIISNKRLLSFKERY